MMSYNKDSFGCNRDNLYCIHFREVVHVVVEIIKKGECTIIIHDDSYAEKTQDEIRRIIQNASAVVYAAGRKQAVGSA